MPRGRRKGAALPTPARMSTTHPRLPDRIRVERDPQAESVRILIDGVPLDLAVAGDDAHPISAEIVQGACPGVRLTLLSRSVEVVDRLLEGVRLPGHDAPAEEEEPAAPAAEEPSLLPEPAKEGVAALQADAAAAELLPARPRDDEEEHFPFRRRVDSPVVCATDGEPWPCLTEQARREDGAAARQQP